MGNSPKWQSHLLICPEHLKIPRETVVDTEEQDRGEAEPIYQVQFLKKKKKTGAVL